MDAFELLKADHRKVAELFDQLESASGKAKLNVFNQIKNELELHTHIEEKIFYPALEKPTETHDLTLEAYEEHKTVKSLLAEMSGAKAPNDEWDAKAKVLRENVEHHVDEEENELFDKAGDALSDEEIERLGEQMEAEKARQLGRQPAPPTPQKRKKKGIVSRIAALVGLGSDSSSKKSAPAKKRTSKKSGSKSAKKPAAKKPAGKKRTGKKAAPAKKRSTKSSAAKTTKRGRKSAAKKSRR
jgi:hemerythrin-like domain-containing protein